MLIFRLLESSAAEWFGKPLREVPDADLWRWRACVIAARRLYGRSAALASNPTSSGKA